MRRGWSAWGLAAWGRRAWGMARARCARWGAQKERTDYSTRRALQARFGPAYCACPGSLAAGSRALAMGWARATGVHVWGQRAWLARAEWGRRLSNLCWYVGGGAFCFCCPDMAKVHCLSKRMSCCSLKSPEPLLPDTPISYVVGALLCGKSKTKQFHPSSIRARPAQAAGIYSTPTTSTPPTPSPPAGLVLIILWHLIGLRALESNA